MKNNESKDIKNQDFDVMQCPKCKQKWLAKGYYDYDEGGWTHKLEDETCSNDCRNLFGFKVYAKPTQSLNE